MKIPSFKNHRIQKLIDIVFILNFVFLLLYINNLHNQQKIPMTFEIQKIEKNRFSILQLNTNQCFICHTEKEKLDKHEAIGGMNRLTSIKWGLILYLCRKCHSELDINQEKKEKLQILAQDKFEELYGLDKFIQEFKMNYKEKYRR